MRKIIEQIVNLDDLQLNELFDLSDVEITNGGFSCAHNNLTSLKGAPLKCKNMVRASYNNLTNLEYVPYCLNGYFEFGHNKITSLENLPEITGNLLFNNNRLESLKHAPRIINGGLYCHNNLLTSLEYCPQLIKMSFYCQGNQLTSLEYGPKISKGSYCCSDNLLTSLEGAPGMVGTLSVSPFLHDQLYRDRVFDFDCTGNPLESLDGIPHTIYGDFFISKKFLDIFPEKYIRDLSEITGDVEYI
tara:strand:- start:3383 stop:4117 length:735 start_codon:yes stop_codon:yes gene_type:complete